MRKFITVLCLAILASCYRGVSDDGKIVYKKAIMYTVFDIVLYSTEKRSILDERVDAIWADLEYLEREISPIGEGFLGKLNRQGFIKQAENPEAFNIISNFIVISKKINQESQGAFDLTVYPLVRLWGFYKQDTNQQIPSDSAIQEALARTGMDNIIFTNDGILLKNNVQIDIGAIAKGYVVDRITKKLQGYTDISAGFVNAGGNIRVFGTKPDQTPWKVGIRNPNGGDVADIIALYDGDAIATSGDYEQYFEVDGKYYHHIFNPKTGRPAEHSLASVSVILKGNAELTDILATTFLVLGKEKSLELEPILSQGNELSLFFIERDGLGLYGSESETWTERKNKVNS